MRENILRRSQITKQLDSLGLDYEIFEAVNGKSLVAFGNIDSIVNQRKATEVMNRPLTPGDIGCSLSHLYIYRKMIKNDITEACILEDDAFVATKFHSVLPLIENLPNVELVFLGHWSLYNDNQKLGAERAFFSKKIGSFCIARVAEFPLGTHAYVIRRSAAKKLLDRGMPVWMPADFLTGSAELLGIDTFVIAPPVAVQHSTEITNPGRTFPQKKAQLPVIAFVKGIIRSLLLLLRKLGIFRKSYIWLFNRRISKV